MFTRLARESPWKAQIGCGFAMGLITAAPGIFIGYMTYFHDHSDNRRGMFIFAAVWVVVGLLVILSSLHQAVAARSPETEVEIEPAQLTPGETVRIRVTQPGPLRLLSIHANLVGEETTWKYARTNGQRTRSVRYLGPHRMLEIDRRNIELGDRVQREASFVVPDIPPTDESTDVKTRWKIEVWGRVRLWPDFMHPFPVTVLRRS